MGDRPELRVFGHCKSGHSYKVCLFLALAGRPYTYTPIDVFTPLSERPQEFRAISRFGEVPVLMHESVCVTQSNAIFLYLAFATGHLVVRMQTAQSRLPNGCFWEMSRLNLWCSQFAVRATL